MAIPKSYQAWVSALRVLLSCDTEIATFYIISQCTNQVCPTVQRKFPGYYTRHTSIISYDSLPSDLVKLDASYSQKLHKRVEWGEHIIIWFKSTRYIKYQAQCILGSSLGDKAPCLEKVEVYVPKSWGVYSLLLMQFFISKLTNGEASSPRCQYTVSLANPKRVASTGRTTLASSSSPNLWSSTTLSTALPCRNGCLRKLAATQRDWEYEAYVGSETRTVDFDRQAKDDWPTTGVKKRSEIVTEHFGITGAFAEKVRRQSASLTLAWARSVIVVTWPKDASKAAWVQEHVHSL